MTICVCLCLCGCVVVWLVLPATPGESMLIERIIAAFAARFYSQNPGYCDYLGVEYANQHLDEQQLGHPGVDGASSAAQRDMCAKHASFLWIL